MAGVVTGGVLVVPAGVAADVEPETDELEVHVPPARTVNVPDSTVVPAASRRRRKTCVFAGSITYQLYAFPVRPVKVSRAAWVGSPPGWTWIV